MKHQEVFKTLQDEVEPFRATGVDVKQLSTLPRLNAIINETQRVMVVVPSRSQRVCSFRLSFCVATLLTMTLFAADGRTRRRDDRRVHPGRHKDLDSFRDK